MPTRRAAVVAIGGSALVGATAFWWRATTRADELVDALVASSGAEILRTAVSCLRAGASPIELLHAAMVLPALSGGDAGDVHAMLVVPALYEHVRVGRLEPVLWAVENAHDWSSTQRVPEPGSSPGLAELCLDASRDRAEPHGAIYAAQLSRAIDAGLAREHVPIMLASLARYLDRTGPVGPDVDHPPGDWDTLVRAASDTRIADDTQAGGLGVHHTTLLDALHEIWRRAVPTHRDVILRRARARSAVMHRVADPALVDALPDTLPDTHLAADAHAFKYVASVRALQSAVRLETAAYARRAAQLHRRRVAPITWPRRDEARALLERHPS